MSGFETIVEQAAIAWLAELGCEHVAGSALAESLARTSDHAAAVSSVACDARNTGLLASVSGVADVRTGWGPLFAGRAGFVVWSHQAWFRWVGEAEDAPAWAADWLASVGDRYRYATAGAA